MREGTTPSQLQRLRSGASDLAVVGAPPGQPLHDEAWIAAGGDPREALLGVWPALEWQPRIAFIARGCTAKLGLVAAGLRVTVVPGLAATALRGDVPLVRVRSKQPATRSVAVATRAGSEPPPQARALAELLHDVAAELKVELQRRTEGR